MAGLIGNCASTQNTSSNAGPTAEPTISRTAAPTASEIASPTVPANTADRFARNEFPYSCRPDGNKSVATFEKKLLPGNGNIVVGAIRDVIGRCFNDTVDTAPRLAGVGVEQVIRVESKTHRYVVVPIKDDTGDIHSLMITQVSE